MKIKDKIDRIIDATDKWRYDFNSMLDSEIELIYKELYKL